MIHWYLALGLMWAFIMLRENIIMFPKAKLRWLLLGFVLNLVIWPITICFALYDLLRDTKNDRRKQ